MIFNYEIRPSDSPFVQAVWSNRCENGGPFISVAQSHWNLVVSRYAGRTSIFLRGPETHATPAYCPAGAEHMGIFFQHGALLKGLPAGRLTDAGIELPEAGRGHFWLDGAAWHFPNYENADTFVDRLVRSGLLVWEPAVEAALRAVPQQWSIRQVERRFLRATGLTHGAVSQIDRARQAVTLLQRGVPILDAVDQAGYADQPHLTRSLNRFVGQTPAQLIRNRDRQQLSIMVEMGPVH